MLCSKQAITTETHIGANMCGTSAKSHPFCVSATYRIAQTSRGLLGKDGTGGDGATEKLGDVGEGGATVRRAGIEGGGRIGTQEGGGSQNGGGEDEAGHGCGWFSVMMRYKLQEMKQKEIETADVEANGFVEIWGCPFKLNRDQTALLRRAQIFFLKQNLIVDISFPTSE